MAPQLRDCGQLGYEVDGEDERREEGFLERAGSAGKEKILKGNGQSRVWEGVIRGVRGRNSQE